MWGEVICVFYGNEEPVDDFWREQSAFRSFKVDFVSKETYKSFYVPPTVISYL